jgi:large subunit ribosomal protein L5
MVTQCKSNLEQKYRDEVLPKLREEFKLTNQHTCPQVSKIIINVGIGRFLENQKLKPEIRDAVIDTLATISGQKPIMILARKSVANFKVREGAPSAFMVTLRRDRMWHFLDRLMNLAMPRIKDFRGVRETAFDGAGNYALGLTEQAVWPEINMATVSFTHGMNINICFEQSNPAMSRFALSELGMPFARTDDGARR